MNDQTTRVRNRKDSCRECGAQLGAGYLCDDCDIVEVPFDD